VTRVLLRVAVRIGYRRLGTDCGKQVPVLHGQPVVLSGVVEVRNFEISASELLTVEPTCFSDF
jgi:hypothetical protein